MPGKVNPVIPEAVSQAAIAMMGHDQMILQAASAGNLELSQFLPLVADALLASLDLLARACHVFTRHCVVGIEADEARCRQTVLGSTAALTALVERIGYERAAELGAAAQAERKSIREVAVERGVLTADEFDELIAPEQVTRLGSGDAHGQTKSAPSEETA